MSDEEAKKTSSSSNNEVEWICSKAGHTWRARPYNVCSKGNGCPRCRWTPSESESLYSRREELYKRGIKYTMSDAAASKIFACSDDFAFFECAHGHTWETRLRRVLGNKSGCPECVSTLGERNMFVRRREIEERGLMYTVSDDVAKTIFACSNTKTEFRCAFGHTWQATPNSVFGYMESGCKECFNTPSVDKSLFGRKAECERRGFKYAMTDADAMLVYSMSRQYADFICDCGSPWSARVYNVFSTNKTGCPICGRTNICEGLVRSAIREMDFGGAYVRLDEGEWLPPGGINGRMLRFDIRVRGSIGGGERAFIVEVDGQQHFEPVHFGGGVLTDHEKQLCTDVEKIKWALGNGISVVRIPTNVVSFGADHDPEWRSKLACMCRDALACLPDGFAQIFIYPGTCCMYTQHVLRL